MKILHGFQDTRTNSEDFALTPYLFSVWVNGSVLKVCGIGLCWGFYSYYIGVGFGIPKQLNKNDVFGSLENIAKNLNTDK